MSTITRHNLYQRQTTLKEIGDSGQQKLQNASVLVVGCGGLGCIAAVYLASSGVGNIHLVDFDVVDVSNLHRQVFYTLDAIGKPKAEVLANYIQSISPFVNVTFSTEAISKNTVFEQISTAEIILDCTDNLPVKYLLNDASILKDKIVVYGSLYKFDGYVATFNVASENGERTTNLRDAFPEIPTENIPNCSELGTLNTIVGIIGLMQANEVLKIVTEIGKPLTNQLLIYNSLDNSQFIMKLKPLDSCHADRKKRISELFETESYETVSCEIALDLQISQADFKVKLTQNRTDLKIISVVENVYQNLPFEVDEKIPLSHFKNWLLAQELIQKEYILVCNRGISSLTAVEMMKDQFTNVKVSSLEGGIQYFDSGPITTN